MKDLDIIQRQLDRVLGFFPRVEARINALFGVNTLILIIAALNVSAGDLQLWYVTIPGALLLVGLIVSYYHLFRANFPDDNGGEKSLIFFKEIQKRTEANYIAEFLECSEATLRNDLLGQIWRNSCIVCEKYRRVKLAIIACAISVAPFVVFLVITGAIHSRIPMLGG
ncbi:MAG: Pycsar system effector family protein [Pseudomonadota bacterium]|nr:Pycsar system effector family protein [Pseudomonadota bacterium]